MQGAFLMMPCLGVRRFVRPVCPFNTVTVVHSHIPSNVCHVRATILVSVEAQPMLQNSDGKTLNRGYKHKG